MNFPDKWIAWINTCISSPSFSFLINGQPSKWIPSSRGLRQGDPLSSLLFILVTQNLSALLNKALCLDLIPGLGPCIPRNFNHLMFADDLLIITRASRLAARNCILCLCIYQDLTGQKINPAKSSIHAPSWCNKKLLLAIAKILKFKLDSFPFSYLGVLISPKKLTVNQCHFLTDRVTSTINSWNHAHLSLAGKAILINSTLLSLPLYYLSMQAIPDSILNKIDKLIRNFLWSNSSNGSSFHSIGWKTILTCKSEGGLGIRNLFHIRTALMTKNTLAILNSVDKLWVDLYIWKYGQINVWQPRHFTKPSGLFFSISKTINQVRANFWIRSGLPDLINFWDDPWCFSIPLSLKPTFLNMNIEFPTTLSSDFFIGNFLDLDLIKSFLGPHLDWDLLSNFSVSSSSSKSWVWLPLSSKATVSAAVYSYLNDSSCDVTPWKGWKAIWNLRVAPKVKVFIWKLALGKLPTFSYLYNLNIGPDLPCPFCNLPSDSASHFIWNCIKSKQCWALVATYLGCHLDELDFLSDFSWLYRHFTCSTNVFFARALFANVCWQIWIARCNWFYRSLQCDFRNIFHKALCLTLEFEAKSPIFCPNREISFSLSNPNSFLLFTDASWVDPYSRAGLGYIVITNLNSFVFAGSVGVTAATPLLAEAAALEDALISCKRINITLHGIYSDCGNLKKLLYDPDPLLAWRFADAALKIHGLLDEHPASSLTVINRDKNLASDRLAEFGRLNPDRSLFFQGLDLPRWLIDVLDISCYSY